MQNEQLPAYPVTGVDGRLLEFEDKVTQGWVAAQKVAVGLTKLEHFAGMAMQGLLTDGDFIAYLKSGHSDSKKASEVIAFEAVRIAKDLLSELQKHT